MGAKWAAIFSLTLTKKVSSLTSSLTYKKSELAHLKTHENGGEWVRWARSPHLSQWSEKKSSGNTFICFMIEMVKVDFAWQQPKLHHISVFCEGSVRWNIFMAVFQVYFYIGTTISCRGNSAALLFFYCKRGLGPAATAILLGVVFAQMMYHHSVNQQMSLKLKRCAFLLFLNLWWDLMLAKI